MTRDEIIGHWINDPYGAAYYVISYKGETKGGQLFFEVVRMPQAKHEEPEYFKSWIINGLENFHSYQAVDYESKAALRAIFGD
jgi:hypothetical protein